MCRKFSRQLGISAKLKEDTWSDKNGSQRYFIGVCRHNFVQSLKGKYNKDVMPISQSWSVDHLPPNLRGACFQCQFSGSSRPNESEPLPGNLHQDFIPSGGTLPQCRLPLNLEHLVKVVFTSLVYCKVQFFPLSLTSTLWEKPLRLEIYCFSSNCHPLVLPSMDGF